MQDYRIKAEVDVHDVDFNGVAKTSAILRYIQTAAQCQLTDGGMSYDSLKSKNRAFLLSRLKLEVLRPLRAYAPLTAITYPCESRGYSFLRCYAIESDGEPIARAISVWALIDTETRGLVRVNDFNLNLPLLPQNGLVLGAMKLPSALTDVGGYGVHYGDVDQNRHMNNTKYPDMYSNFLPLEGKWISSITISYLNEAVIGDKLRVQRAECDGRYYFRTVRGDGKVNSEAEITLSDIN
jgi:medium-chain acyl-[acyl-carrier-protein] hydrolase